jgi:hypothetical protein
VLFSIKNLSSIEVTPAEPWKLPLTLDAMTKEEFASWASLPSTDWFFLSAYEGRVANLRVSADNPAEKMHGFIADYDADIKHEELLEGMTRKTKAGMRPAWAHRTISGGARVIWLFEKPICIAPGILDPFLTRLTKELNARRLFANLDDNFRKPAQYYSWMVPPVPVSSDTIKTETLHALLAAAFDASTRYNGEGDIQIPIERLQERVNELFPGRLKGSLEFRGRTNAFWVPDSSNPSACIVTETGMVSFSQDRAFYSWGEILGQEWVREFQNARLGGPLAFYWYDGNKYWRRDQHGSWRDANSETTKKDMAGIFNLSLTSDARGEMSEVDQAMLRVRENRRVDATGPILYSHEEIVKFGTRSILNTSRIRVIAPAQEAGKWGEKFPWIASLLNEFFDPFDSLRYFLAWLRHFYTTAASGAPAQGQAVFIAGPAGLGKTLLGTRIVAPLMGGGCDASSHIAGGDQFNNELFEVGVLNIDDAVASTSYEKHLLFTNAIKKFVANTQHRHRAMRENPTTINWIGRIIVTLNDDPESMRMIPYTDTSILDKIMLFKATHREFPFPPKREIDRILSVELPELARWLIDWQPEKELIGSNRFGVCSFHHPEILEDTRTTHPNHAFSELLDKYLVNYKAAQNGHGVKVWIGSATDLLNGMLNDAELEKLARHYVSSPDRMGQRLAKIMAIRPEQIQRRKSSGKITWEINIS